MEKLSFYTEEVGPVSRKIEALVAKLDGLITRTSQKTLLLGALGAFGAMAGGAAIELHHNDKAWYLEPEISQEIYEGFNLDKSDRETADLLRQEVGTEFIAEIEHLDSITNEGERAKYVGEHRGRFVVSGFGTLHDKYNGPSNEEMEEVVDAMPLAYQIDAPAIRYKDVDESSPVEYVLQDVDAGTGAESKFLTLAYTDIESNEVDFFAGAQRNFLRDFSAVLHEQAHLKDWKTDRALTLSERLALFQSVITRVKSPDRFRSAYVEAITNPDKQKELGYKAAEYYGEITAAYFDNHHAFLSQKDRDIIEGVIHKTDLTFTESDRKKVNDKIEALRRAREVEHAKTGTITPAEAFKQ